MPSPDENSLIIFYAGIIPSMKNSREPVTVGKGKTRRTIYRKNDQVVKVMRELAGLAQEQLEGQWDGIPMPPKTPFVINLEISAPDYNIPDIDGSLNTCLDAFQGVLYKDDKFCVETHATKLLNPSYLYSAMITIAHYGVWHAEKLRDNLGDNT